MKTIRQIAEEIGVTKQAVFYRIKKPPLSNALQPFTSKLDGVLMVSLDGENLIKQAFTHREDVRESQSITDNQSKQVDALISMLQIELEAKNEQLAAKDEQIDKLTAALEHTTASLHAAQALHAGTMQKQLTDGGESGAFSDAPPGMSRIARAWRVLTKGE